MEVEEKFHRRRRDLQLKQDLHRKNKMDFKKEGPEKYTLRIT